MKPQSRMNKAQCEDKQNTNNAGTEKTNNTDISPRVVGSPYFLSDTLPVLYIYIYIRL
jgi:hypothetical protein